MSPHGGCVVGTHFSEFSSPLIPIREFKLANNLGSKCRDVVCFIFLRLVSFNYGPAVSVPGFACMPKSAPTDTMQPLALARHPAQPREV